MRWNAAAVLVMASGCRSCPVPEHYFDRQDAITSLNGFAYAVETGQYRFAYDTLTPESQELITYSKFRFALRWGLSLPELDDIPIRDLILNSKRSRYSEKVKDRRHRELKVKYQRDTEDIIAPIFFELEAEAEAEAAGRDPIWRIDLKQTLSEWSKTFPGGRAAPVTPAAARGPVAR